MEVCFVIAVLFNTASKCLPKCVFQQFIFTLSAFSDLTTCFLICYNFADSVTVITRVKVDHIVPFNGCKPSHTSSLHNDTFALAMNKGKKIA